MSTDFTSLLDVIDDLDAPKDSKIPPINTEDVHRDGAAVDQSEAETNKEIIEIREEIIYGNQLNL